MRLLIGILLGTRIGETSWVMGVLLLDYGMLMSFMTFLYWWRGLVFLSKYRQHGRGMHGCAI